MIQASGARGATQPPRSWANADASSPKSKNQGARQNKFLKEISYLGNFLGDKAGTRVAAGV
ncbi:hypothetical protein ACFQ1A_22255 [Massilia pinisoli]